MGGGMRVSVRAGTAWQVLAGRYCDDSGAAAVVCSVARPCWLLRESAASLVSAVTHGTATTHRQQTHCARTRKRCVRLARLRPARRYRRGHMYLPCSGHTRPSLRGVRAHARPLDAHADARHIIIVLRPARRLDAGASKRGSKKRGRQALRLMVGRHAHTTSCRPLRSSYPRHCCCCPARCRATAIAASGSASPPSASPLSRRVLAAAPRRAA